MAAPLRVVRFHILECLAELHQVDVALVSYADVLDHGTLDAMLGREHVREFPAEHARQHLGGHNVRW